MAQDLRRRWALVTALRGLLMLAGGVAAMVVPDLVLLFLAWIGGAMLLADGLLGLWSLTFGGARTGNYWFDVARNVLAIIAGVLVLIAPWAGVVWVVVVVAIQAVIVGVMEIIVAVRQRAVIGHTWPVLLSGLVYILFGAVLIFQPWTGGVFFVIWGGVMMILFAFGLFGWAWRLWRGGSLAG